MNPEIWAAALLRWQAEHGRHHLPWQGQNPYHVWLSEIMLQQTQVRTVLQYFPRFLQAFPRLEDLAAADLDAVLTQWAGLGYYRRAQFLHRAAQSLVKEGIPTQRRGWEALPGVGRSTAAAIVAFCFHRREAILDGNVKRLLCRAFDRDGDPADKRFEAELWALAEALLPAAADMPAYTQALMDLGALICTPKKPRCEACPLHDGCLARQRQRIEALPRPKKARPPQILHCHWLLIFNPAGALFVQKRTQGIWPRLDMVPHFESLAARDDFIKNQGLSASWQDLPAFSHRLTHRLLHIQPHIHLQKLEQLDGWQAKNPADCALPKPLSALLAGLRA